MDFFRPRLLHEQEFAMHNRTLPLARQSSTLLPLFIGEPKPLSFELILKNTALFDEIAGDRLLMAVQPAGPGDYEWVGYTTRVIARTDYPQYYLTPLSYSSLEYLRHTRITFHHVQVSMN
jgi:hypothetical protein